MKCWGAMLSLAKAWVRGKGGSRMKATGLVLAVGALLMSLVACSTRAAQGQDPADELRILRAENDMLKAQRQADIEQVEGLGKEIKALREELHTLKAELAGIKVRLAALEPEADKAPPTVPRPGRSEEAERDLDKVRKAAEEEAHRSAEERRQKESRVALEKELAQVTTQLEQAKTDGRAAVALRNQLELQYKSLHAAEENRYQARVKEIEDAYRKQRAAISYPRPLMPGASEAQRVEYQRQEAEYRRRVQELERWRSEMLDAAQVDRTGQHRKIEDQFQPQVTAIDSKITRLAETVKTLDQRRAELQAQIDAKGKDVP